MRRFYFKRHVMKFFTGILLFLCLQVSMEVSAQNVTISEKNTTMEKLFRYIEKQTGYVFFFDHKMIDKVPRLSVDLKNVPLEKALESILKNQPLSYSIVGKNIVIKQKEETPTYLPARSLDQDTAGRISGKVTDDNGEPLPGASIVVKGTTVRTVTDAGGNYQLSGVPRNGTILFTFVGMIPQEFVAGGNAVMNIKLQRSTVGLDEVVAIGYGTQKKVNLTGAVGTVSGKDLIANVPTNTVAALQGRLPGVTITQPSGQPGDEGVNILIRGIGTMNYAGPMILVDGLESRMDNVSPGDIESVSVLKDASSAAIYGSRAANGVILVTTKRGKNGVSEINYRGFTGWQATTNLPDHLPSHEYAELYNEANRNQGLPPRYSNDDIAKYKSGIDPYNFPNTDWQDLLITESGATQDHNLSFSGGNNITSYRVSFEYFNQKGLIKGSTHKRYNARINLDSKVKEWLTVGTNISLSRNNVIYPISPFSGGEEFFRQINFIPPTISNKNADGTWNRYTDGNPIAWVDAGGFRNGTNSHLLGSVFGELTLLKGLTLKGVAGVNYDLGDNKRHVKTIDYYSNGVHTVDGPNSVTDNITRQQTITLQSLLNYNRKFGKHAVKGLLGASREAYQFFTNEAFRKGFPSNDLDQLNGGSTEGMTNGGYAIESRLGSIFGRANYEFDNRYLLELNMRRDASSRFARGYRVGWFPSLSAGWRVTEENFMQGVSWIDNLKLRGSWGQLGNNNIGDYTYFQRVKLGQNYNFGGIVANGAATALASNAIISWEKTTELDLGFDLDLFRNKLLSISADYYDRYTDDILSSVPVSMIFGLPAPITNAGAMRNKGVELLLEHNHSIGAFQYSVALNGAFNKNKVERYKNPSKGNMIYAEGEAWGSYYGYEAIGIYQTDAEAAASPHLAGVPVYAGDLIFKDKNKDGKIDGDDRIVLGNTIPEFTYGANINLSYKGFDLSAFFQGASKVNRVIGAESFWAFDPNNGLRMHLDRTIVENGKVVKNGYYPRILITDKHNKENLSSFSVLNASYLRLKTAQIGYTIPTALLKKAGITRARVYASGQNLLTFTKFPSGFDPELLSGSGNGTYPQVKFYTVGIDVTF
ncbi:TonB-linked outer membrane protein, SusC/RagA family [Chitinophaga niabensis]|uniref:TonB-linked outer membrane protein, SusC/RagA family n=2 Tax=Chitinophaga niabensis TaxID=536979 RepID=A0A1N6J1A1_9BACT|nr:TonB-linked outer membrane protein, SusC/RagA family [Chitinophaga niabensis]